MVAAVALGASLLFGVAASAGTTSFTDPAGDAKGGPDITAVSLTSDGTGTVQLAVTVPGLGAIDGAREPEVDVYFDTDKNDKTGSGAGNEYNLLYWRTASDWGWDLGKWNGTKYQEVPASQTLVFSLSGDTLSWRFNDKVDIVTSGFNFYVGAGTNANTTGAADYAPDQGVWTFDASTAVIAPAIGKGLAVPAHPVHGKLFSVTLPVTRTDTGAPLQGGALSTSATIGGKPIPKNASLANANAQIAVQIPARAKGKTLVVKVTVTANGKTATRTVSYVIR